MNISTIKEIWNGLKNFQSSQQVRTGTKITVYWLVFSAILIVWLVIGIPWLSIFYPQLVQFAPNISNIIVALIGGSALTFATSETRKTIENVKNVDRPRNNDEESPKNPYEQ